MALTKITNDIISNADSGNSISGIDASTKVQPYSVTGDRFSNNLVYGSNITIAGSVAAGGALTGNSLSVSGNISVAGNATIQGNLTYQNVQDLAVDNSMVLLAANNSSDILDIGFVGRYNPGNGVEYGGLVRNFQTGVWNIFGNSVSEPEATVDWANVTYDDLQAGTFFATVDANVTGNVNANSIYANAFYYANGSSIVSTYSNANVEAFLPTYLGNLSANNAQFYGDLAVTGDAAVGNLTSDSLGTGHILANNINASGEVSSLSIDTGNISGANLTLTGDISGANLTASGAASITGNLSAGNVATGNISAGNINTANIYVNNAYYSNGQPWSNYSNASVANYLPTYTGNLVSLTGNVTTTANIQADYLLGNGAFITGLPAAYSNADVQSYLASNANVVIETTGNITTSANISADYLLGNGAFITGLPAAYSNADVQSYLASNANVVIETTGNITTSANIAADAVTAQGNVTANLFIGDGSQLTGMYANADVAAYLASNAAVTITTTGNITTDANITAQGNIQGNYFIGNGSQLTGLPEAYGNANVAAYLPTYTGNLASLAGNVTTTANIEANYVKGNGYFLTDIVSSYTNANVFEYLGSNSNVAILTTSDIETAGDVTAHSFIGDGSQLTNLPPGDYSNTNVAAYLSSGNLATNITTTANVSGTYILGNGSQLTGLPAGYSNAEVATYLASGNVSTNIITTANVTANLFIGNGSQLSNIQYANVEGAYANANVANYLASNSSVTITTTGDVTANAFIGDGSQLTGMYANADVAEFLASSNNSSNVITTGNISGNYILGNGSQLTGLPESYSNANVATYLASGNIDTNIITTANVTANFFIGDGSQLTNLPLGDYSNANVANYLGSNANISITVQGNVTADVFTGNAAGLSNIVAANVVGEVANAAFATTANTAWSVTGANVVGEVANATFANTAAVASAAFSVTGDNVIGAVATANVAYSVDAANVVGNVAAANTAVTVTANAQPNITSVGTLTSLTVTGDLSAGYLYGDGSNITGLPSSYANSDVANYLASGNVTTNITTSANISGNFFIGDGSQLTNLPLGGYSNTNVAAYLSSNSAVNIITTGNVTANSFNTAEMTIVDNVITTTGNMTIDPGGNLFILSNVQVSGNITYVDANTVTTDSLLYVAANNAINQAAANGGGISVGPGNAPYASLTYDSVANAWASDINLYAIGNISTEGSLVSDTDISAAGAISGGTLSITGISEVNSLIVNGDQTVAGTSEVTGNITGGNISTAGLANISGNVIGNYFVGNGAVLTNLYHSSSRVTLGTSAGSSGQGNIAIAVGVQAGQTTQGNSSIAIGQNAGQVSQSTNSVSIGAFAGQTNQGNLAVALGFNAGNSNQGNNSIAIGTSAGANAQGNNSIFIGSGAYANGNAIFANAQSANSIVLNANIAANAWSNGISNSGFYVSPVRFNGNPANTSGVTFYDPATNELTYGAPHLVPEYGQLVLGSNVPLSTTAADILTLTLPSDGSWRLTAMVSNSADAVGNAPTFTITDASNNILANSNTMGSYSSASLTQLTTTFTYIVSGTAGTVFKLRGAMASGTGLAYSQNAGRTRLLYEKVAGLLPSMGQMTGYAKYTSGTATQTPITVNSTAVLCATAEVASNTPNIQWNTATGTLTLQPGYTYRLRGKVSQFTQSTSGATAGTIQWYQTSGTPAYVGVSSRMLSAQYNSINAPLGGPAEYTVTPSVVSTYQLRFPEAVNITSIGGSTVASGGASWIEVEQLGTSNWTAQDLTLGGNLLVGNQIDFTSANNIVAIGNSINTTTQGVNSILIGTGIANAQAANSIVLNASSSNAGNANLSGFYVNPVRVESDSNIGGNTAGGNIVFYNTASRELTTASIPAFSATSTASVAITAGGAALMTYNTEEYDTNGWFANSRYTPQRAGWYQINCSAVIAVSTANWQTNFGYIQIRKNGSRVTQAGGYGVVNGATSRLVYCNGSTDYIEVWFSYSVAGNATQETPVSSFNGYWVRP